MLGIRVGAVLAARKNGVSISSRHPSEDEELKRMAESDHHEMIEDFDIQENTKQKITFRKYPFIEWGVALACFAAFAFSEYMIQVANEEMGNYTMLHNWTCLTLLSILLFVSIYSLYEGEIETVTFDKKID